MERISRFLSLVLRHKPEAIGIQLDENGWVGVDVLLDALRRAGRGGDRDVLERVVAGNDKKRFAFSPDGTRIRANQGHSVAIDLDLEPVDPPPLLYHGTATRFLDLIGRDGVLPGNRLQVHLSPDESTAVSVGRRHGKPIVLTIRSGEMARDGHRFYLAANGVWLTDRVPPRYIAW